MEHLGPAFVRAVLDALPYAIFVVDSETGKIVAGTPRVAQVFGYWPQELIGRPVEDLVPVDLRNQHVEHRAGFTRTPSAREMGPGRRLLAQRKDGSTFRVEVGLGPIYHQLADLPAHLVVAIVRPLEENHGA